MSPQSLAHAQQALTALSGLLLLVDCSASKVTALDSEQDEGQAVAQKASPQEDCARYKAKYGSYFIASDNEDYSQSRLVAAIESKRAELQDDAAVNDWYQPSEELKTRLENELAEASASDESLQALMAVLRHLGYSESRLQELWNWRPGEGSEWKRMWTDGMPTEEQFRLISTNRFSCKEGKDLCAGLGVQIDNLKPIQVINCKLLSLPLLLSRLACAYVREKMEAKAS